MREIQTKITHAKKTEPKQIHIQVVIEQAELLVDNGKVNLYTDFNNFRLEITPRERPGRGGNDSRITETLSIQLDHIMLHHSSMLKGVITAIACEIDTYIQRGSVRKVGRLSVDKLELVTKS
jgi:hypothetical protein